MKQLNKMLNNFKHSALRIETLPVYKIPGEWEEYLRYVNGVPEFSFEKNEWIKKIEKVTSNGGAMKRIRVVPNDINTYLKFEAETGYVPNFAAGEQILTLSSEKYNSLVEDDLKGDYWIFDETEVLKLNYDTNGKFNGSTLIVEKEKRNKIIKLFHTLYNVSDDLSTLLKSIRK